MELSRGSGPPDSCLYARTGSRENRAPATSSLEGSAKGRTGLESFDLVACIGASWIYGGHGATLNALQKMAAPESWIVVGEPYWRHEPEREYLDAIGATRNDFGTHYQNAEVGRQHGLEAVYTLVSSQDDWGRYEGLEWYAAETWASDHRD